MSSSLNKHERNSTNWKLKGMASRESKGFIIIVHQEQKKVRRKTTLITANRKVSPCNGGRSENRFKLISLMLINDF